MTVHSTKIYIVLLSVLIAAGCMDASPSEPDRPEQNRFGREVLIEGMDEPMQMEFDENGNVYWIERKGGIHRINTMTGVREKLGVVATDPAGEAGLLGLLLAIDFSETGHFYIYYSSSESGPEMRISRLTLNDDGVIAPESEVLLLSWPADLDASHMGGGMAWDKKGNMYIATGDNSNATQYTPIHWVNEGGRGEDARRSAANSNDLRGKILRIHPETDGTYSIPEGNLFADDDPGTRPEIYTMGNRNPWRLSIDSKTSHLLWGEVGPDAGADSSGVGPRGYDEFNATNEAANFGWPYFIGYNRAYNRYDRSSGTYGEPYDPFEPINDSPNNTGISSLPPVKAPILAYPYAVSEEYPILGSGGRSAVGGPVFYKDDFGPNAHRMFPDYYEGHWFITDFVRNWIMALRLSEDRTEVTSLERFVPAFIFNSPIDMDFGPEGDLYVLEYGTQWGVFNDDARLTRIVYNDGNRPPVAIASADQLNGAIPLDVSLSVEGTHDPDNDPLTYTWRVLPDDGSEVLHFDVPDPVIKLEKAGTYRLALEVKDSEGVSAVDSLSIIAGNTAPQVEIMLTGANNTFHFADEAVAYRVQVQDVEDGTLGNGISPENVSMTWEYVPAGLSRNQVQQLDQLEPGASARHLQALELIQSSDCYACHMVNERSAGPAYIEVSRYYQEDEDAVEYLAEKILKGGVGVWGETPMPAHPAFTYAQARILAAYVLDLGGNNEPLSVPASGVLPPWPPVEKGDFVLHATYSDRGAEGVSAIKSSEALVLRHPFVEPQYADTISGARFTDSRDPGFFIDEDGAFIGLFNVDLTGIDSVFAHVMTRFYTWSHFVGGTIEVRIGAPDGRLIGEPEAQYPPNVVSREDSDGEGGDNAPGAPVFFDSDPVGFDVSSLAGPQSLYFVFRNERAEGNPLFLLEGIAFLKGTTP